MIRYRAEEMKAKDLRPGELFSRAGPLYWDRVRGSGSVGEKVYIRTEEPVGLGEENDTVYRITIEKV